MKRVVALASLLFAINTNAQTYITGFKPWGRHEVNSSEQITNALDSLGYNTLVLEVNDNSLKQVDSLLKKGFDNLIMLGMGNTNQLKIEISAYNKLSYHKKIKTWGLEKEVKVSKKIVDKGPYKHNLPYEDLEHIINKAQEQQITVYISQNSGDYYCNAVFYKALNNNQKEKKDRVYFIHIPPYAHESKTKKEEIIRIVTAISNK